jgi:hypothetical protein
MNQTAAELQNKILSLYSFAREILTLKYKVVKNISEYDSLIDTDKLAYLQGYVYFPYGGIDDDVFRPEDEEKDIFLAVKKADFMPCPAPQKSIAVFIAEDKENFHIKSAELIKRNGFSEDEKEQKMLTLLEESNNDIAKWIDERDRWCELQYKVEAVNTLFKKIYQIRSDLELNSDNYELMSGFGMLSLKDTSAFNHPVLLKHMIIEFDSKSNIIKICDTEKSPELYEDIFSDIENIDLSVVGKAVSQVQEDFIHPFDKTESIPFLTSFVHALSSEGDIFDTESTPTNQSYIRITTSNPVFFIRKKINGAYKFFNSIIDNINNTGIFPASIGELVSGGEADVPEIRTNFSIEERLAQANGENREILLSKAANREQLEIAERIEKYNAVLVQGPPGTGKTHTIANLLGHFLAQGKNVLITSYTSKALAVLKDKLPEPIKDLCVSVTGEDNKDMERSIDAISDYTASHTSAEMQRKISECETERNNILTKVDDVRKNLYRIKKREFSPIVFLVESYTIKQASEFIVNHTELSEFIHGKDEDNITLPINE